jgi:uncharacterized membrane protein
MFWFFLAVVLVLAVSHPGFRKFLFGSTAIAIAGIAIFMIVLVIQDREHKQKEAAASAVLSKCTDSHMDKSKPFDVDAYLVARAQC